MTVTGVQLQHIPPSMQQEQGAAELQPLPAPAPRCPCTMNTDRRDCWYHPGATSPLGHAARAPRTLPGWLIASRQVPSSAAQHQPGPATQKPFTRF